MQEGLSASTLSSQFRKKRFRKFIPMSLRKILRMTNESIDSAYFCLKRKSESDENIIEDYDYDKRTFVQLKRKTIQNMNRKLIML